MAQWFVHQDTLKTWAETVSGLTATWQDNPQGYKPTAWVLLQINSINELGNDFMGHEYDSVDDEVDMIAQGVRTFTLEFIIQSYNQKPGYDSKYYLDMAKLRMNFESNLKTLADAGMSVLDTLAIIDQDFVLGERRISQSQMDLLCSARVAVRDTGYDGAYINRVSGTITGENEVGPYPSQNYDVQVE